MDRQHHNSEDWRPAAQRLRSVELGKHKALLAGIMRQAIRRAIPNRERALEIPYRLLSDVETADPRAVAGVLETPQFGAWANDALHCLLTDAPAANGIPRADSLGRLALFAATAAMRARFPFAVEIPLSGGAVSFPALGTVHLTPVGPGAWGRAWLDGAVCHVQSASAVVDVPLAPGAAAAENWSPLPQVSVIEQGLRLDVVLDHDDPCLDRYGTERSLIPRAELPRWRDLLAAGWQILARDHRALAPLVADAVRTIIPLVAPGPHRRASGTEETSFGAIALSLPADALGMAEVLVHEAHHTVLGAAGDVEAMVRDDPGRAGGQPFLGYAPWRDDPRPAHALLQGIYAHYGMGLFWRREYLAGAAAHRDRAAVEFGRMRAMTARGASTLAGTGLLTDAGRELLAGIEDEVARWRGEPLPPEVERQVADLGRQHEARWQARWRAGT